MYVLENDSSGNGLLHIQVLSNYGTPTYIKWSV